MKVEEVVAVVMEEVVAGVVQTVMTIAAIEEAVVTLKVVIAVAFQSAPFLHFLTAIFPLI